MPSAHHGTRSSAPGVGPDGTSVELPALRVRQGGYRFFPSGTLTRLSDQGLLATFDITPVGKHIVFDRSRQNSDIVLIDLPK